MKITALKEQQRNPGRVNVFVDGAYSFSLTIPEVVDYKVRVGSEVDAIKLEALKKASDDGKVRSRAYEWLLSRPHSTRELQDYLRRKKTEPELVSKLIAEFKDKKVLNDERFAEWYTDRAMRKHKSTRMARYELRKKGIDQAGADASGAALDDTAALIALVAKLAERPRYADQPRLIRYLQSKGFSYGDIKEVLKLRGQDSEL